MGGVAYNTISALGRQAGEIAGVKGGESWMREKLGWEPFRQGGGGAMGFGTAFRQKGFVGLGQQAKRWFGFGFDQSKSMLSQSDYMQTIFGGPSRVATSRTQALWATGRTDLSSAFGGKGEAAFMQSAGGIFRRRKIAGGVALGVGAMAASQTIGFGNIATLGIGAGAGAVLGGAIGYGVRGSAATLAARSAAAGTGRRIGGKIGLGVAGLGLITGIL